MTPIAWKLVSVPLRPNLRMARHPLTGGRVRRATQESSRGESFPTEHHAIASFTARKPDCSAPRIQPWNLEVCSPAKCTRPWGCSIPLFLYRLKSVDREKAAPLPLPPTGPHARLSAPRRTQARQTAASTSGLPVIQEFLRFD
jgi:hypothetical protein